MKVRIDLDRCQGHGHCWSIESPAVFEPADDDGHASVVVDLVPVEEEVNVRRAVQLCPEGAIAMETA